MPEWEDVRHEWEYSGMNGKNELLSHLPCGALLNLKNEIYVIKIPKYSIYKIMIEKMIYWRRRHIHPISRNVVRQPQFAKFLLILMSDE